MEKDIFNVRCKACGNQIIEADKELGQCTNKDCCQKENFGIRGYMWRLRCSKCGDWRLEHHGSLSSYWKCIGCKVKLVSSPLTYS